MIDRKDIACSFLAGCGWGNARREHLAGDASDRRYERLWLQDHNAVLMDAPPGKGDDPADFIRIGTHLQSLGLSAPKVIATDLENGFLLIEDLGDDLFARVLDQSPERETALYRSATDVLLHIHRHAAPPGLPDLTAQQWAEAAAFAIDWYAALGQGANPEVRKAFVSTLADLLEKFANGPRILILRDYHAENLIDLPDREGLRRVGLLDFQLAQMGQPEYDLVSLVQDARRDVSTETAKDVIRYFADARGKSVSDTELRVAVLGAQRALRIMGIFARLALVSGKTGYLKLMPRVWHQLKGNLSHPALAELRTICDAALPQPSSDVTRRIAELCPKSFP